MPFVKVDMWTGLSNENKEKLIKDITGVFEEMHIPKEAVHVVINEIPKENWGIGGEQSSKMFKEEK